MPIEPKGQVERNTDPRPSSGYMIPFEAAKIGIAAWCPDEAAQEPPEQVHFIFHISGLDFPIVIRFKSPDTLGFIIEELARYRREVWPDAEPVTISHTGENNDTPN